MKFVIYVGGVLDKKPDVPALICVHQFLSRFAGRTSSQVSIFVNFFVAAVAGV